MGCGDTSSAMTRFFDRFWHKTLRRPYTLTVPIDKGQGAPVLLLHGLGSSAAVWPQVIECMDLNKTRVIALDLLGFGASPKPDWIDYTVDDHVASIVATLRKRHVSGKFIIAGHSMGCLIAVRLARKYPEMVRHLILYEMPLYEGLPEKRRYRMRLSIYRSLYKRIVDFEPEFTPQEAKLVQRLAVKITGFHITEQTWLPYRLSLQNTIIGQTTADDLKHIDMPMDAIYGYRDMFVIRGKPVRIFGKDSENITAHSVNAAHRISKSAGKFLCQRIADALKKQQ